MIILETSRLIIRRLCEADFDDLFAITGDAKTLSASSTVHNDCCGV
jgi:hypothetical protein